MEHSLLIVEHFCLVLFYMCGRFPHQGFALRCVLWEIYVDSQRKSLTEELP